MKYHTIGVVAEGGATGPGARIICSDTHTSIYQVIVLPMAFLRTELRIVVPPSPTGLLLNQKCPGSQQLLRLLLSACAWISKLHVNEEQT